MPPTSDGACNPGVHPEQELNQQPLGVLDNAQLSHTNQGNPCLQIVTRLDLVTGKSHRMSLLCCYKRLLFRLADVVSCSDGEGYLGGL